MKRCILFFLLLFPIFLLGQSVSQSNLKKLDPKFVSVLKSSGKILLKATSSAPMANSAGVLSDGREVYGAIIYTTKPDALRAVGIRPLSVLPNFVTARVTSDDILKLSGISEVRYVDSDNLDYPTNDVAKGLLGADLLHSGYINTTPYKGNGVIVGIIDTGIDWKHPDFRFPSDQTKSRILYIWDQTLTPTGSEANPSDFDYGVEYTKAQIDDELDGSPTGFVREQDIHGHGTHVAGSAAGDGAADPNRSYGGIAPEADLIIVKSGNGSFSTTNLVNAITYIKNKSIELGKPAVINMSNGSNYGSHDGTDPKSVAADDFSGDGRVVVVSAGNDGSSLIHTSGTIAPGASVDMTLTVPAYTAATGAQNDNFGLDIWLNDQSDVTVTLISPSGITTSQTIDNYKEVNTADGTVELENSVSSQNDNRELFVYVYDADAAKPPAAGTWTVRLTNNGGASPVFHGWLFDNSIGSSAVSLTGANSNYTLGNSSLNEIIIGAYVSRWRWLDSDGSFRYYGVPDRSDNIASFSSIGPTRDGRLKPDLAAPGQAIISARSSSVSVSATSLVPGGLYMINQGTSMASPISAGAVALLLQKDNMMNFNDLRSTLTATSQKDSYTGASLPNNTWGYGKIDVFKAMTKLYNPVLNFDRNTLTYDQWTSNSNAAVSAGVKLAVKFTPGISGIISGCFFHPREVSSLTSPVKIEVWSDDGTGKPGSKIGNTVQLDQLKVAGGSWNFLNLLGSNVTVSNGNNYFVVFYFDSGSLNMYCDSGNPDGRSLTNSGSGWTSFANDFRIRTVVTQDASSLPVEIIAFNSKVENNGLALNWSTATEVNSYCFQIERRQFTDGNNTPWVKIGEVKASGNSNTERSYSFLDRDISTGKYSYRLKVVDLDGSFEYSEAITAALQKPGSSELLQNFPNPFNPVTRISYSLASDCNVKLKVYDVLGNEVANLVDGLKPAGKYTIEFNASHLSTGVYLYKLEAGQFVQTRKFVIMK